MRLRLPFLTRRRRERELDEEIAAHLALATAERIARGEPPREAAASARRELGNEALVKESTRAQWKGLWLQELARDARYGLRMLARTPGFTFVAILTLALGIGANTAILSVVDAVLLRPLGYSDPERLVVLLHRGYNPVAPGNYLDWKRQSRSFERMGAAELWSPNLTDGSASPEKIWALRISADVLPMLGVAPLAGRFFAPEEDVRGRDRVAILGYGLWKRRFAADPKILGRSIALNGEPYAIVGVMPPGFRFAPFWATNAEMSVPLPLAERAANREGRACASSRGGDRTFPSPRRKPRRRRSPRDSNGSFPERIATCA